jgi:apolipoprotein N-acyltransferase
VYAVSFLVAAVSALVAAAVAGRRLAPLLSAAVLVLAIGLVGAARLGRPAAAGPTLKAALLQPGIPQQERLDPNAAARNYAFVIGQAREAAGGPAGLIVIPESAFPTTWDASPTLRRDLTEIASACRCPVVFNDIETEPGGRYYNVARLVTSGGLAGRPYRKVHLVPFGEYVPLPKLFFFVRQISTEIGEFSHAPAPTLLTSGGLRLGMAICYEITYDALPRCEAGQGANLLATISNDSWYGRAGAQPQHFAAAVLRAVENGRTVLRSAITGISGAADERGRILAQLPPDTRGTLLVTAHLISAKTAWTRWGYALPLAADGAAAGVLLFAVARWWRRRSHD